MVVTNQNFKSSINGDGKLRIVTINEIMVLTHYRRKLIKLKLLQIERILKISSPYMHE
jgi:hypothetical protein